MSARKRLVENIVSLGVLQGANYILPLVTLPYLTRALGPERFGLLTFAQAFIQYLVILTDYGFNLTATREIAVSRKDHKRISEVFSAVMTIKAGLMILSFVLMTCIVLAVPTFRVDWQVFFITFIAVVGNVLFPAWFFQGMERMKYVTVLNIIARSITMAAIFLFVHRQGDYLLAAGLQSGGILIAGLASVWVVKQHFGINLFSIPHKQDIIASLRDGSQIFTSTLCGNVYGQGGVLITGLIAGNAAAGYYTLAQKVTSAIVGLVQPLAQGIYPHVSQLFLVDDSRYRLIRSRVLLFGGGVGLLAGTMLFLFASHAAYAVLGHSSTTLVNLLRVYSLTMLFTIQNVLINPFILSMKMYSAIRRMYITVALAFLIVSVPLTFTLGPVGMAFSILGVESFVFIRGSKIAKVFV